MTIRNEIAHNTTNTQSVKTGETGLLDARISLISPDEQLTVTLSGRNITDEHYHDIALDNVLTSLTWGASST